MLQVIEDTTSKDTQTQACYNSFKQLSKQQQQLLISKIEVIDQSANILEIEQKIVKKLRLATPYPKALKSRLEGWWFGRVVNHLMDESHKPIRGEELQGQIDNILNELKPDNLPNDFPALIKKDKSDLSSNELIFVAQLELIELTDNRLRTAIGDYYRAFTQRTKWLSDGLIMPDELEKYETILIGEWQRYFEIMKEEIGNNLPDENRMIELGKSIFKWAETSNHTPIRRDFSGDFARGSYHILSNDLKVGWHPEFQTRLGHLITQAVSQLV